MKRLLLTVSTAIALLTVAACGGTSYGSTPLVGSGGGEAALGSSTPTPAAATAAPVVQPAATSAPTPPPPPTSRPAPPAATFAIGIWGDNSGHAQFDPNNARVYTGTVIVFTNHDTKPRSVVADSGAFNSGPIAPGGSWRYTASTPGQYSYHDGTRPYAVASFQVISQ